MDYKEIHQECYEELCVNLNREPDWKEISESFRDRISSLTDHYKDLSKYEDL